MTRILYIAPTPRIGGAERSLLELIRGLPRDRYEPFLMVPGEGALADNAREAGATVITEGWPRPLLKLGRERNWANRLLPLVAPVFLFPVLLLVARVVRDEGIDLIHTNGIKAHLLGWPAAVIYRVPLVWHLRDVLAAGPVRGALRIMSRFMPDLILANSRASAASMALDTAADGIRTCYNGIDTREFAPRPRDPSLSTSLGIGEGDFVIGAMGMLTPLKGHVHLIRALPRVIREVPGARLVLVGEEMYDTAGHRGYGRFLREEAGRLGLEDRVIFTGRRDDVVALYNLMDVVVLSSVRPESFGRVLVEAMACERPVIGTDIGGPREILTHPGIGLLVPPGDPEALAVAILELHRVPGLRDRMGRAARASVEERFTRARHVREVCAAYDFLLGAAPGPPDASGSRAVRPVRSPEAASGN